MVKEYPPQIKYQKQKHIIKLTKNNIFKRITNTLKFVHKHSNLINYSFGFQLFTFALFFTFFVLNNSNLYGQVKIKEKVKIEPKLSINKNKVRDNTTSTHTVRAVFDWDTTGGTHNYLRAKIKISKYDCDYSEKESEWGYHGHVEISETTELAGSFSIEIHTQGNNYPTDLSWFDMGFAGTYSLYVDGQKIDDPPKSIRPWRAEPIFNIVNTNLCVGDSTSIEIGDTNNTCGNIHWSALTDQVTLSVIQGSQYVSFYNTETGQNVGTTITGLEEEINKHQLRYDNPVISMDENVIVEASVNGMTSKDTVVILAQPDNYLVSGEIKNNIERIVENEKLTIEAWLESGGICGGKVESSENTTYNARIIQGAEYGDLVYKRNNVKGDSLIGLVAENDKVTFDFYANGMVSPNDQEVKVRIDNSRENTQPLELTFQVGPADLVVTFEPEIIAPGDTADIVIKHRKDDGTLENFSPDQDYEVRIIEGSNYGTILSSNGVDTSDYFESVYDGMKFIAYNNLDTTDVEIRLKVSTYYFPSSSTEKGGNSSNLSRNKIISNKTDIKKIKTQNSGGISKSKSGSGNKNTDGIAFIEQIYGIGKAMIGKKIVVRFEPSELLPGDTASVKIYKKDANGNLIEFPAEQKYEIGIMEGCEYGDLLVNDTTDVYFTNVTGPIKYIATDSLTSDSANVTLRVGIISSEGTTAKSKTNKNINGTAASYCSIGAFIYTEFGIGNLIVKKGGCEDLEVCGQLEYSIIVKKQKNNFLWKPNQSPATVCDSLGDPNSIGESIPVDYSRLRKMPDGTWENAWRLKACKNEQGKVQFKILESRIDIDIQTPIIFDFVSDVCYDKISAKGLKLISNLTQVQTIENPEQAMKDFCGHHCYPQKISHQGYVLEEVIEIHEDGHKRHFERIINRFKDKNLFDRIKKELQFTCELYDGSSDFADYDLEGIINQFQDLVYFHYHYESGKAYKPSTMPMELIADECQELKNERKIQGRDVITDKIKEYINQLTKDHNLKETDDCDNCGYTNCF